jgi:PhzF family phenazine biosynthesis protein
MEIFLVDAFAERPFQGNPAAVVPLATARPAEWMQAVAAEMNLSETAFFWPGRDGFDLRWFTPTVEVDLCGHATLASAHVAWETRRAAVGQTIRFHTLSGMLTARRAGKIIAIDLPALPAQAAPEPEGLAEALGVKPRYVGRNRADLLVLLDRETDLRALTPDFPALARLDAQGVIVTSLAESTEADFVSRYFAPKVGIDEDPVTGAAHCCLGPFWSERLGRTELVGYQASARGGRVRVHVMGDRVVLGGQAALVLKGELLAG